MMVGEVGGNALAGPGHGDGRGGRRVDALEGRVDLSSRRAMRRACASRREASEGRRGLGAAASPGAAAVAPSLSLSLSLARFNLSYDDVRPTYGCFTRIFSSAIPNSTLQSTLRVW